MIVKSGFLLHKFIDENTEEILVSLQQKNLDVMSFCFEQETEHKFYLLVTVHNMSKTNNEKVQGTLLVKNKDIPVLYKYVSE